MAKTLRIAGIQMAVSADLDTNLPKILHNLSIAAEEGAPSVRRAAFTSADAARASLRAFESRGFSDFSHIAEAPSFEVAPLLRATSV